MTDPMTGPDAATGQMADAPTVDDDMRAWANEAEIVIAGTLIREDATLRKIIGGQPYYGASAREVACAIVRALEDRNLVIVGGWPKERAGLAIVRSGEAAR